MSSEKVHYGHPLQWRRLEYLSCDCIEPDCSDRAYNLRVRGTSSHQAMCDSCYKAFELSAKQGSGYKAYFDERVELAKSHSHMGKDGEPIKRDGSKRCVSDLKATQGSRPESSSRENRTANLLREYLVESGASVCKDTVRNSESIDFLCSSLDTLRDEIAVLTERIEREVLSK